MKIEKISAEDGISKIIKSAFDMDLDISGGWGYSHNDAIVINEVDDNIAQLQHTLCSIRTHLELNLTREAQDRYAGINLNEVSRENIDMGGKHYEKITYKIDAMLESEYAKFIDEYKQGYGKDGFDLEAHFNNRKSATKHKSVSMFYLAS